MSRLWRHEAHTLAGAYALDAVTGPERARFERHLARCQACALELAELREATARLAGAVAADPPPAVIQRAVAAAARTPQLPPANPGSRRWLPWRPARPWLAARRRVAWGLAAVFLATAAASGGVALTAAHHADAAQRSEHALAEVLNAPDAVLLTSRVKAGGTVTVVMSRRDRALVFTSDGLPPLPVGRCYQVWLMGPAGDRPAALLPSPDHGMTSPVIATGVAEGDWVGLTDGPPGIPGHLRSAPILMLSLAT
jgi:hypothetical protein